MKQTIALAATLCIVAASCHKPQLTASEKADADPQLLARPSGGSGEIQVDATKDYDYDEAALLNAGWNKTFSEEFDGGLAQWNIWNGGAFNNELQHYQGSNLAVSNGNLVITAKKETVTGNKTPWDNTQKTFQYTSGRIECKSNVSASTATPRVRMIARIKLPQGYGMWPAFWSYGDPWPTKGEIDILEF